MRKAIFLARLPKVRAAGGPFFELTPSNGSWSFNTIYSLSGWGISANSVPRTSTRAAISLGPPIATVSTVPGRCIVQRSGSTYNYVDLYDFTGGTDGQYVFSNPAFDSHGNIFGTTNVGGSGYGVVWKFGHPAKTDGRRA